MISGLTFYKSYLAIKLHFTTKYDVVKYQGKLSTHNKYDEKNDKSIFESWGRKVKDQHQAIEVSISNFLYNDSDWIHEDFETAFSIYTKWLSINNSIVFKIAEDLKFLQSLIGDKVTNYDNLFQKTPKGNKAPLLQLFLTRRILPDTIVYFDRYHFNDTLVSTWLKDYPNDPLISRELFKVYKYRNLVSINNDKLLPVFNNLFLGVE